MPRNVDPMKHRTLALLVAALALVALVALLAPREPPAPCAVLPYEPVTIERCLTARECDALMARAAPRLRRSMTLGDVVSAARTSEQAWLGVDDELVGAVVAKLRARAAQLVGVYREDLFEPLQVVRYGPGQEYRPHYDACVRGCPAGGRIHRRATLLVYLNDDFEEGATHFPNVGVRVRPRRGDGVLFYNVDADTGAELDAALHAGEPVRSGTKWVANCWVRYDPRGRLA